MPPAGCLAQDQIAPDTCTGLSPGRTLAVSACHSAGVRHRRNRPYKYRTLDPCFNGAVYYVSQLSTMCTEVLETKLLRGAEGFLVHHGHTSARQTDLMGYVTREYVALFIRPTRQAENLARSYTREAT
jgi:hypothetical protein